MPSAQRLTTPVGVDADEIEGRYAELGDYTVGFETFKQDGDPAPYFVGLPDNRCPCVHWGVVTAGQITLRWPDHQETYGQGEAYYAPPGHLPLVTAGSSVIEFTPSAELRHTMEVLEHNMASQGVGA